MNEKRSRHIPNALRWQVWERDDFTCQHCGARRYLTIDHVEPFSLGGGNDEGNLQTLCNTCNSKKGNRLRWLKRAAPFQYYPFEVVRGTRKHFRESDTVGRCKSCGGPYYYEGDGCVHCPSPRKIPPSYCEGCEEEMEAGEEGLCSSCKYWCQKCGKELNDDLLCPACDEEEIAI